MFKINTTSTQEISVESKPIVKSVFVPTQEQLASKEMAIKHPVSKIQAYAGTGKTSELVYISSFLTQPSLYMTFNVTMAREAESKFGDHVVCMTTHSLAYRKVGRKYSHKLSRPQGRYVNVALTGSEVARYFRLPDIELTEATEISKNLVGLVVKDTVDSFEMSSDEILSFDNIPAHYIKDMIKKYGTTFDKKGFNKLILRYAKRLWEERTDKLSEVCCKHNTYLKLYQLSKPDLSSEYSIIYLDESQDLNPVTRSIVLAQEGKCKLIFVGDSNQQIYSWNGSINALQSLDCPETKLSKSFRFGEPIAELATLVLANKDVVRGLESIESKVGYGVVDKKQPYTMIFRTNMELIFTAIKLIEEGTNVSVNIDLKDFVNMLKSAVSLKQEDYKKVKHENIVPFATWQELLDEGKGDRELGRLIAIIEDDDPDKIINTLHYYRNDPKAHVVLTTCHKAKGLEYNQVILADDFPSNYNNKGEFVGLSKDESNLLYVGVTRAINSLDINKTCREFYDMKGIEFCNNVDC